MDHFFHPLPLSLQTVERPKRFTFPFYYTPHALAQYACKDLQHELESVSWPHNFGLDQESSLPPIGKMFGVLIVQNEKGELGFLKAYSGKLYQDFEPQSFAPFILSQSELNIFMNEQKEKINQLTQNIEQIELSDDYKELNQTHIEITQKAQNKISECEEQLKDYKIKRDFKRVDASEHQLKILAQESMQDKFLKKHFTEHWNEKIKNAKEKMNPFTNKINLLKETRKNNSINLQNLIFDKYRLLNAKGESKSLLEIFEDGKTKTPPAGSGDCVAPKLLNFAFKNNLSPIALAEFWWGAPHKGSIRAHKQFYPACSSKCRPIMKHMLEGLQVDPDPINYNDTTNLQIQIVYEDEDMMVINKPSGLLSVPGKILKDSVQTRLEKKYPHLTCPLIVHRLDQCTSGIMLISKTKEANKNLQSQFIKRTIKKYYHALLDGDLKEEAGTIDLPLRGDPENRPCQLVCFEFGKKAVTNFRVLERKEGKTLVEFEPITGRTHQLRMHAAHEKGLGIAILGDDHYGNKASRLHLHAFKICVSHPSAQEKMVFEVKTPF